ncbi:MAG: F-type H+-transporting ATPase subunit a [Saprospiraceae bacterium]|jgi:F-type H+-transporting ATPase subunit a
MKNFLLIFCCFFGLSFQLLASDEGAAVDFDPGEAAFHHIADANVYSIGPISIPLPCFLYAPDHGWSVFLSSDFSPIDAHGNGSKIVDGYVLHHSRVKRVVDFHGTELTLHDPHHDFSTKSEEGKDVDYLNHHENIYKLDKSSTADGGVFGGGITSFYDFSMTKNVVTMMLVCLILFLLFRSVAKTYQRKEGQAPSGLQGLMETIFVFIQDEVAKPFLGKKWEKFLPLLMTLFFFILGLNLFGQIPFFGGSNVSGNLAVTAVLAIIAFLVTTFNGNKHYWGHTLWMPGVPAILKILILTPVEILGLFIKPITLMLRLFANITAGHMVMVIFVGLIFYFGQGNTVPSLITVLPSTLLTLFMMAIELLVAFIQAFVFTILTASYIGAATEEAHH